MLLECYWLVNVACYFVNKWLTALKHSTLQVYSIISEAFKHFQTHVYK